MGIVKANAYGHGLVRVARQLSSVGVDALGVACLEEAQELRAAGISLPITLLEGVFEPGEYLTAVALNLTAVIHHPEQIDALKAIRLPEALAVWIKIDTGMHRLGIPPESTRRAWERLSNLSQAHLRGFMTHFACADSRYAPMTGDQLARFQNAVAGLPGEWCLANSAAILGNSATHGDWVRPGLMLYGVAPFPQETAASLGLRPVMTFTSRIIARKQISAGETVGYGATWVAPTTTTIGVVAAGYADGYPRHTPSGTALLVNGRRAPLIGRVSMDMLCVDLSHQPAAQIGDPVVLWGAGLPVEEIAVAAGTIPYELLCHLAPRVTIVEQT